MVSFLARTLFWVLVYLGKPFGGLRPQRLYNLLARAGFKAPVLHWHRDRWGNEMRLSPFYFQDRHIIFAGTYDLAVNQLMEAYIKPGMVCLDIGANIGHMALHMARKVGPSGKVFAFEPVPEIFQRLQENIARNHLENIVSAHELALSNQSGYITMAYGDVLVENQGMGSIVNIDKVELGLQRRVRTQTMDEFAREMALSRVDFAKLDIQGAEILLLEGGRAVFSSLSPDLVVEFSTDDLQSWHKSPHDLVAILLSYGYQLYRINRDGQIGPQVDSQRFGSDFLADFFCTKRDRGFIRRAA